MTVCQRIRSMATPFWALKDLKLKKKKQKQSMFAFCLQSIGHLLHPVGGYYLLTCWSGNIWVGGRTGLGSLGTGDGQGHLAQIYSIEWPSLMKVAFSTQPGRGCRMKWLLPFKSQRGAWSSKISSSPKRPALGSKCNQLWFYEVLKSLLTEC